VIKMIFAWDEKNREHLARHDVSPGEAEEVIGGSGAPYPMELGEGKLVVWGQTEGGRYLQVIFVLKRPQGVAYESLTVEDWREVEGGGVSEIVRVIHAMDLTPAMKKRFRKRRR
jgi:hypothetical protein